MTVPLLEARGLSKTYASRGRRVAALDNVSLHLAPAETLGIVGPSGSGKSTLARVLTRLIPPDSGAVALDGADWLSLRGEALRRRRQSIQMVFQDPLGAFNPRTTVGGAIADPLRIHRIVPAAERVSAVAALLDRVGLPKTLAGRAIHEISGGQRQRVALARALASRPRIIVLDEAVSALDVSIRGQILELLVALQREDGIAYLFVSHDLAVVHAVAHRVAVMADGRIVETGPTPQVVVHPQSSIARALVAAVPRLVVASGA